MINFATLWENHPGRSNVCDDDIFENQCAMRMATALEKSGVSLHGENLKLCYHYSYSKFKNHLPGHVRSAQELANVFYRKPTLLGAEVKLLVKDGSVNDNISVFERKKGMVFIMNGWGNTDHIDVWNGFTLEMKGSADTADYSNRGQQVWFWEL